jgi:cytoskeletal protein RodZ
MSDGPKEGSYWRRPTPPLGSGSASGSQPRAAPTQQVDQGATSKQRSRRGSRSWDGPNKGLLVIAALAIVALCVVIAVKATHHTSSTTTAQPTTAPSSGVNAASATSPPKTSAQHQTTETAPHVTSAPTYQAPPTTAAPASSSVPTIPMTTMPNLVGMTEERQVDAALAAAHLNQGAPVCSYVGGNTQEVTGQDPAPGTMLLEWSGVTVDWLLWRIAGGPTGDFRPYSDSCPPSD